MNRRIVLSHAPHVTLNIKVNVATAAELAVRFRWPWKRRMPTDRTSTLRKHHLAIEQGTSARQKEQPKSEEAMGKNDDADSHEDDRRYLEKRAVLGPLEEQLFEI